MSPHYIYSDVQDLHACLIFSCLWTYSRLKPQSIVMYTCMHTSAHTHIRTYILISIHVFILFHTLYLQILIEMYTHAMRTSAYNFHPLFTYDTCPTSSFCSACLVMYIYIFICI